MDSSLNLYATDALLRLRPFAGDTFGGDERGRSDRTLVGLQGWSAACPPTSAERPRTARRAEGPAGVSTERLREVGRAASSVLGMQDFRHNSNFEETSAERLSVGSGSEASASTATFLRVGSEVHDEMPPAREAALASSAFLQAVQSAEPTLTRTRAVSPVRSIGTMVRVLAAEPDAQLAHPGVRQVSQEPVSLRKEALSMVKQRFASSSGRGVKAGVEATPSDLFPRALPPFQGAAFPTFGADQGAGGAVVERQGVAITQAPPLARVGYVSHTGPALEAPPIKTPRFSGIATAKAPLFVGANHAVPDHQDDQVQPNGSTDGQMRGNQGCAAGVRVAGTRGLSARNTSAATSSNRGGPDVDAAVDAANDAQGGAQHIQGDVFFDGVQVGRWISRFLSKEAGRASSGPTGFDSRRNALLPGATVGR